MTSHMEASRTSKPLSLSEESDIMILRGYCRAKGSRDLVPFHIGPIAHDEEEEMFEEEQRESRLPGYIAEDNPVLDRLRSQKEKVAHLRGQSSQASQTKGPT